MTEYIINQTLQKDFHNKADWNNCLKQFNESNIFQSYEWGELKESEGWMPLRVTVSDNESLEIILIGQILIKKVFGVSIAWCPGGPLIRSKSKENILAALDKFRESITEYDVANLRCKTFMQDNNINREFEYMPAIESSFFYCSVNSVSFSWIVIYNANNGSLTNNAIIAILTNNCK